MCIQCMVHWKVLMLCMIIRRGDLEAFRLSLSIMWMTPGMQRFVLMEWKLTVDGSALISPLPSALILQLRVSTWVNQHIPDVGMINETFLRFVVAPEVDHTRGPVPGHFTGPNVGLGLDPGHDRDRNLTACSILTREFYTWYSEE